MIAYIDSNRKFFGVEPICSVLQFAPRTYYAAKARPLSARAVRDSELKPAVARVHRDNFGVYGVDKVWAQLNREGVRVARYGAVTMKNALASTMTALPDQLRRSLTWDRGKELSAHAQFKVETGIPVYFADPHSPWQRGSNENTNGLLRQYFPKGTDLARWSAEEIEAVASALNSRPRKTLGWRTPAEALNEYLLSSQQQSVATTG